MVVVGVGAPVVSGLPASASATNPMATVGMPFGGQWASDVLVNPPYTSDPSYPGVDPANNEGDWATNVWAPEGTPIKLHVTSPDGPVTFHWVASTASCDGNSSKIEVYVNGADVGWIFFAHFQGGRGTNVSDPQPVNGMTLGTMHDFGAAGCNDGPHLHVEMSDNHSGALKYSCWTDNGQPGVTLNEADALGQLGSLNQGTKQPCQASGLAGFHAVTGTGSSTLYCPNGINLGTRGANGHVGSGTNGGAGGQGGSPGCGSSGGRGGDGGSGTTRVAGGAGGAGGNGACPAERFNDGSWLTAAGTPASAPCNGSGANGGIGGHGGNSQGAARGGAGGAGGSALFAAGGLGGNGGSGGPAKIGAGGNGAAGGNGGSAPKTQGGTGGNGGSGGNAPAATGGAGGRGGNGGTAVGAHGGNGGRGGNGGNTSPGTAGTAGGDATTTSGVNGTNGANGA
jgi:hypothetical protein